MESSHRCPLCNRTSHNPTDVVLGWCSACKVFDKPADEVRAAAAELEPAVRDSVLWRLAYYGTLDERGGDRVA